MVFKQLCAHIILVQGLKKIRAPNTPTSWNLPLLGGEMDRQNTWVGHKELPTKDTYIAFLSPWVIVLSLPEKIAIGKRLEEKESVTSGQWGQKKQQVVPWQGSGQEHIWAVLEMCRGQGDSNGEKRAGSKSKKVTVAKWLEQL